MADVIDLCSSDEDDMLCKENFHNSHITPSSKAAGKRKAAPEPAADDDDECQIIDSPPIQQVAAQQMAGSSSSVAEEEPAGDDDVQFQGRTGTLALADFPHSRENCVTRRFLPGKERESCPNCYCYVCDQPAAGCP